MTNQLRNIQQATKSIYALRNLFHPIVHLYPWNGLHTVTKRTRVLHPSPVQLESLTVQLRNELNAFGGVCVVYATHRRSDDGKLSHIGLDVVARTSTLDGKFSRMVLQVCLRNARNKVIEIIDCEPIIPPMPGDGTASSRVKDIFSFGMNGNTARWDWQHKPGAMKSLAVHRYPVEVTINSARLIKAEFRLVAELQEDRKVKRLIPQRTGTRVTHFLLLQEHGV